MAIRPSFPSIYRPFAVTEDLDPFDQGILMAKEDVEVGTLLWSARDEICECAIVLAPEKPREESLPVMLVAMLGLGDALGALVPPVVAVTFSWPDRIEVNGGVVGGIRMAIAETPNPTAVPDWLVLGFSVANKGGWRRDRRDGRHRTTLVEEGCVIDPLDLLESFSRHFLAWVNRWQSDGIQPVQQAWISRAPEVGKEIEIDGQGRRGTFTGLDERGGLELVHRGRQQVVPLDHVVMAPTWSL